MELWDQDYRDLMVPAYINFNRNGSGEFQFGTVEGWMDCRFSSRDGSPSVEFSWDGQNDNDHGSGRGCAVLRGQHLEGRIFIHCGDDSGLVAEKQTVRSRAGRRV
jgi:hypothetical protein